MNNLIKKIDQVLNSDNCKNPDNYAKLIEIRRNEINGITLTRRQLMILKSEGLF